MKLNQTSLKSRLIVLTIVITIIVFGLVLYAQQLNKNSSSRNIANSHVLHDITQSLAKINSILQLIEKELYEQLVTADQARVDSINESYAILHAEVIRLTESKSLHRLLTFYDTHHDSIFSMIYEKSLMALNNIRIFKLKFNKFNVIALDVNKRYPAMDFFEKDLLPTSRRIQLAFEIALYKNNNATKLKNSKEAFEIERLFRDAQYFWSRQIINVRMFISNRSGIFGDRQVSIENNLKNRKIYFSKVMSIIKQLTELDNKNKLSIVHQENVEELVEQLKKYEIIFNKAKKIHLSDQWRKDIIVIENDIQPQLDIIWSILLDIQLLTEKQTNDSINVTQFTADKISHIIWYSAFIFILVMAIIYLAFEFSLRRPIVSLAKALDAEARGETQIVFSKNYGSEIIELFSAFSNMRNQVHTRQTRLQSLLDNTQEGIIITDEKGVIESYNNAAEQLFKYSPDEVIGRDISMLIPWPYADSHEERINEYLETGVSNIIGNKREMEGRAKDSSVFPVSLKLNEMIIDKTRFFTAVVEDISERKALMDDLQFQANHDSLTNLYNRSFFTKALEKTVNQHIRGNSNNNAIMYLDLDNFKYVNDTMGHLAGDQLIKEVAIILQKRIRKTDTLARIGGDEFAILLYHDKNIQLEYVANCFREILSNYTFKFEGSVVDITCSIGGAYINDEIKTKEHLLARADFACHEAKRLGRNQAYIYTKSDDKHVSDMSRDIGWTRRIREALSLDNFILACQPIYNTSRNSISYYEVLIRMLDADDKVIMPFGFIPAAERFGLMLEIDAWVIRHSLKLLSEQHKINPDLKLSINLSAHSIDNELTFDLIRKEIELYHIDPTKLLFEVTETIAIANIATATTLLENIQSLGCKTALDDFGVGYSSFAYLADLPVDVVKIDGFFVKDMAKKSLNRTMVKAINEIAHELGKTTVAEFVEDATIYAMLNELGVDYSQGYHLGKPEIIYDITQNIEELFFDEEKKAVDKK